MNKGRVNKKQLNQRRLFNKRDIWFFGGLIIFALLVFLFWVFFSRPFSNAPTLAQINIEGQETITIDLSIDNDIVLEPLPGVLFEVRGGAVAFAKSDCPSQICVLRGFIQLPGQMAVCLPNRVSLIIVSDMVSDVDIFAY